MTKDEMAELATQLAQLVGQQSAQKKQAFKLPDYAEEFGEAMSKDNQVIQEPPFAPYPSGTIQYFYKVLNSIDKVSQPADLQQLQSLMKTVEQVASRHEFRVLGREVTVKLDPNMFPDTTIQMAVTRQGAEVHLLTQSPRIEAFCHQHMPTLKGLFSANRMTFKVNPTERLASLQHDLRQRGDHDDQENKTS